MGLRPELRDHLAHRLHGDILRQSPRNGVPELHQGPHLLLSRLRAGHRGAEPVRRRRPALFGLLRRQGAGADDRLHQRTGLADAGEILRQPQLHQQADLPRFDAQAVPAGRAVPDPRRSLLPQERLHEGRQRPHGAAQDALRFGRHAERLEKQLAADHLRRARARTLHGGFPPARPQALGQGVRRPERRLQHPPHAAVVLAARRQLAQDPDNPLFVWPIPQHELESPGSEILPNESNR